MQSFIADLLERSCKTFLQAFLATFAVAFAAPASTDLNAWKAAAVAALVASLSAAISAVTSMLSRRVGDPNTASLVVGKSSATLVVPAHQAVALEVTPQTVDTTNLKFDA